FNDPVPVPDPAERAVKMAIAMRETANSLITTWRQRDRELGFGVGIAQGYATLGQIGFADRSGYTAIGTVGNLAARLRGEAKDGQILVAGRVAAGSGNDRPGGYRPPRPEGSYPAGVRLQREGLLNSMRMVQWLRSATGQRSKSIFRCPDFRFT